MMKRFSWISAALAATCVSGLAAASSHREAPAIAEDPVADNTDTYAFVRGSNLVVVAGYNGLELPEGAPNWAKWSDDVLYEIHMARGGESLEDALTYQFRFKTAAYPEVDITDTDTFPPAGKGAVGGGKEFFAQLSGGGAFAQTYSVTQIEDGNAVVIANNVKVPPPNVGPKTNEVAYQITGGLSYEAWFVGGQGPASVQTVGTLQGGGRVFAGPRDDPFWVDLGGIFDLAQLRPVANPASPNRDSVAYMNVHAIVLEIPLTVANGGAAPIPGPHKDQTVGVWASASRRKVSILRNDGRTDHFGPWRQVSRLGLPLINEVIIGLQDKDGWNRKTPADDAALYAPYFLNPVVVVDAEAIGFYEAGGPLAGCPHDGAQGFGPRTGRTDIIGVINLASDHTGDEAIGTIGDVLRVDLGQTSGFPNGRRLEDNVVDVMLSLALCKLAAPVPGGPVANEAPFNVNFPYLLPPWEGRTANPRPAPSGP
jgi:hypothetical protein